MALGAKHRSNQAPLSPFHHLLRTSNSYTSLQMSTSNSSLILRRQLSELTKHPVEGFSAGNAPRNRMCRTLLTPNLLVSHPQGLVDDNNLYEWEVMIIGYIIKLFLPEQIAKILTIQAPRYPLVSSRLCHSPKSGGILTHVLAHVQ